MKVAAWLFLCGSFFAVAQPAKVAFDQAAHALAAGDYAAAERGFLDVLRQEPRNAGALGNLAIVYSRTDRTDKAIATYERALRLSPDDPALLLNLGLAYLKEEAHRRALPLFARVVALDSGNRQARQLLDLCRLYTGQVTPALGDLEALRKDNPHDQQILFLLGVAYLRNGDRDAAKSMFEQMFAAEGPARAQFLLGKACYEASLFQPAEESFLEALRLDPHFPGIHLELGKVYIGQYRAADAARELKTALQEDPDSQDGNYYLGSLLVQQGQNEEAIPYLERALELKPDSGAAFYYLGKARLQLKQAADAVPLLQKAVALNPDHAAAFFSLAQALKSCGRNTEANRALEQVRKLNDASLESNR